MCNCECVCNYASRSCRPYEQAESIENRYPHNERGNDHIRLSSTTESMILYNLVPKDTVGRHNDGYPSPTILQFQELFVNTNSANHWRTYVYKCIEHKSDTSFPVRYAALIG